MKSATISGLAKAGGVGVETVRYYQRRGLLETPGRPGGAIRRYDESDLGRLRFTLEQIAELIALDAGEDRARARQLAQARVAALDVKIAELQAARDALDRLHHDCAAEKGGPCPILGAFDPA
jgi:MerR family mercuric resistance operon transcriptional regulator